MKKITIGLSIIIILLTFTAIFLPKFFEPTINRYSYTTAICDESKYCEDYYIECDETKQARITPTGFAIQQNKNWEDSREQKSDYCN